MDSPLAGNGRPEKILWYQEVLSLDPNSRIFLPYARLLAEFGRRSEALDVLKTGLSRHPEFLEARLFLIELLYAAGHEAEAGFEADSIIEMLSQSPALWRVWSRRPGLKADMAAMLVFFSASLQKNGHSLADVFEAGIAALEAAPQPEAAQTIPAPEPIPAPAETITPIPVPAPTQEVTPPAEPPSGAYTMPEDTQWYALDSVPEDDDIYDEDEEEAAPAISALLFAQSVQNADAPEETAIQPELPTAPAQTSYVPAGHPVPRGVLEGKSSLCTRSMARVLEEQGAAAEAAEIYRELLETCTTPEEEAELNAKLASLLQNTESTSSAPAPNSGVIDMLESLAARLENRTRA